MRFQSMTEKDRQKLMAQIVEFIIRLDQLDHCSYYMPEEEVADELGRITEMLFATVEPKLAEKLEQSPKLSTSKIRNSIQDLGVEIKEKREEEAREAGEPTTHKRISALPAPEDSDQQHDAQ